MGRSLVVAASLKNERRKEEDPKSIEGYFVHFCNVDGISRLMSISDVSRSETFWESFERQVENIYSNILFVRDCFRVNPVWRLINT